ncbi:MAG: phosphotransferase [Candidatus Binatus sp.]|uniref:phosphotransferase n=1 Tax=Candidatus Binatus sp. TaxID=2811406 RepID=UPI0027278151|nr:phosphotransferase [Candidatus Binatus sp.]MDO8432041.1 phosphotransferase [Candidatus Binatus sp.]
MAIEQEVSPVRENHRFDESSLERYLSERMPDFSGPLTVRQFVGGQSNPTFMLQTPRERYVMRKKPPGTLLQSAHQVEREYRIINALANTDVPVPRVHLLCEDPAVIGTAFFVMECVDGRIMRDPLMPDSSLDERAACYDSLNDVLARLHKVDYAAVGLGDFGRPQAYVARQVARWTKQYEASKFEEIPEMDKLIAWVRDHIPARDETTIAHGDYRIENIIFHPTEPKIVAVLDWELSTLGHPLGDIAWCCRPYHCPPGIDGVLSFQGLDLKALGIPTEEDFIAKYCERVGRDDVSDMTFFDAFSFFRGAAIAQGIAMRAKMGNASGPDAAERGARARLMAELGWQAAQRL